MADSASRTSAFRGLHGQNRPLKTRRGTDGAEGLDGGWDAAQLSAVPLSTVFATSLSTPTRTGASECEEREHCRDSLRSAPWVSCEPPGTARDRCAQRCEKPSSLLWRRAETPEPGCTGFERTVIPQLERALIAGHDVVLLGERGQGKTRLLRTLGKRCLMSGRR